MITARFDGAHLHVTGHADDKRVCAAVSALLMTLHRSYGCEEPAPGSFSSEIQSTAAQCFVENAFKALADCYPDDFRVL